MFLPSPYQIIIKECVYRYVLRPLKADKLVFYVKTVIFNRQYLAYAPLPAMTNKPFASRPDVHISTSALDE